MANTEKPASRSTTARTTTGEGSEHDRIAELEAENARLRQRLADHGVSDQDPRKPEEPSFGISEGTRDELERNGKATSPFTGKPLSKSDLPK